MKPKKRVIWNPTTRKHIKKVLNVPFVFIEINKKNELILTIPYPKERAESDYNILTDEQK